MIFEWLWCVNMGSSLAKKKKKKVPFWLVIAATTKNFPQNIFLVNSTFSSLTRTVFMTTVIFKRVWKQYLSLCSLKKTRGKNTNGFWVINLLLSIIVIGHSMGSLRVRHDWATSLSLFTFKHWRRKWQPTPVFLPGESQGRGAWWAAVYGVTQSRTWLKWRSSSSNIVINYYYY